MIHLFVQKEGVLEERSGYGKPFVRLTRTQNKH